MLPEENPSPEDHRAHDLPILKQCPICSAAYTGESKAVVEESDEAEVVHFTCPSCQSALLAVVALSQRGVGSIATMTDLNAADAKRFRGRKELCGDDVLAFHAFLTEHKKTFANLFR